MHNAKEFFHKLCVIITLFWIYIERKCDLSNWYLKWPAWWEYCGMSHQHDQSGPAHVRPLLQPGQWDAHEASHLAGRVWRPFLPDRAADWLVLHVRPPGTVQARGDIRGLGGGKHWAVQVRTQNDMTSIQLSARNQRQVLIPLGKSSCPDVLQLLDQESGLCFTSDTQGPCRVGQLFIQSEEEELGVGECK